MSAEARIGPPTTSGSPDAPAESGIIFRIVAGIARFENRLLVTLLAGMLILPLLQVLRRLGLPTGIDGAESWLNHFNLFVGVFGGLIAARESRLLSLSTLPKLLPLPWQRTAAATFAGSIATAVCVVLCLASIQLVTAEYRSGREIAYRVPVWLAQTTLPLGFGLLALRLAWNAGPTWIWRLAGALPALAIGLVVGLDRGVPFARESVIIPALVVLFLGALAGTPIFTILAGAAVIFFWGRGDPLASIPLDHYEQVVNPLLPMMPLFTLTGYFLAESGASRRLVRVFLALFGPFRGGPAIVTALVCAFFTTFTGGSGVTILALGGLLMPVLIAARYSERDALGLLTGAGSLGILLPPCLPLILYAIIANVPISKLFLGGILPGLFLITLTALWGIRAGPPREPNQNSLQWPEVRRALWDAKWELLLPVVAFTALFFCLPAEAAALTAAYALFVETVLHRDLKITRDVPRVMTECGLLVGGVLLILGVAMGFTNFLITAEVPDQGVAWVRSNIHSPWVFLLALNVFLLIVGCLMDIFSAIIVVVPLIVPIGIAFGIDPVHLGIIFLANLELGYLTPPVGMNLFLSSYRFGKPMSEITRAAMPMFFVLLAGVLVITYVPALTTWLAGFAR